MIVVAVKSNIELRSARPTHSSPRTASSSLPRFSKAVALRLRALTLLHQSAVRVLIVYVLHMVQLERLVAVLHALLVFGRVVVGIARSAVREEDGIFPDRHLDGFGVAIRELRGSKMQGFLETDHSTALANSFLE